MSKGQFPYRSAIITGASAGIGAALAHRLAAEGVANLILVARRRERLETLAGQLPCECKIVEADLTTETGLDAVAAVADDIDLLINNAGFATFGAFARLPGQTEAQVVRLNCIAPVRLTSAVLPGMVARGHGAVVNIGSGQSFQAMPYMSTYAASKAFVLHWSEGLRAELRGSGVRIIAVCPGSVATEFNQSAGLPEDDRMVMKLVSTQLENVLDATVDALRNDHGLKVPGFANWALVNLSRFGPRAFGHAVTAAVMRRSFPQQLLGKRSTS